MLGAVTGLADPVLELARIEVRMKGRRHFAGSHVGVVFEDGRVGRGTLPRTLLVKIVVPATTTHVDLRSS
jgi:peptide methionine sulfoxide reductase MsrB